MTAPQLALGGLKLPAPLAAVTKFAILAVSGAGKSNTAVVMAEELHTAGIPWVAVDPKGDWWGIRSSATGKSAGLDVPVFGGLHGDIPLEPASGTLVANLIVDERLACVLDVSEFDSKAQQSRFLTDLALTLLKRNRDPLHLFLEEADEYLPQRFSARGGDATAACVGAWQRLVKRGRFRGLGVTLITQRSAALNKDALNQIETLIAMRVTAPLDRKAIEGWVQYHALSDELIASLSSLGDGEAWVWSPHVFKLMERVQFRRRRTFDSGATPEIGTARAPAKLADVDLDAIKEQMADTIARVEADDPKRLRAQIRDLQRELRAAQGTAPAVETIVETIEVSVPYVPADVAQALYTVAESLNQALATCSTAADTLTTIEEAVPKTPERTPARTNQPTKPATPQVTATPRHDTNSDVRIGGGAARMLVALAEFPNGLTRAQLATRSNLKKTGGTFSTYLSRLSSAGYAAVNGQHVQITDTGSAVAGVADVTALAGDALLQSWRERVGGGARRMLDALIDAHPQPMTRDALAETADITITGGTFGTYLSRLRSNDLIVVDGDLVRANDDFMEAIR